ncbi:hypothetical protein LEP1GSC175_0948 [Leptospira santarosai str. HAI821]|uniref:hypothetical protein n=1 Tax=Leptospira santarosai TaxID=28183 RepID=UPI0002BDACA9|nr:hypothetical protein [Leptospira santarosai]EMO31538.1 hypothetical protein LEP1GSC175_0948 [Leptospira santarosai str. HAI821]
MKKSRKQLIRKFEEIKNKYESLATDIIYSTHSNNYVEANNQLPYIFEGTIFELDTDEIKISWKKNQVKYSIPDAGDFEESIEEFFESVEQSFTNLEYDELLLSFYQDEKFWKHLDSKYDSENKYGHEEIWESPTGDLYLVYRSYWQGEHLTEDSFQLIDYRSFN